MISGENPISIGQKYVKLQLIKEIQISRQMTIYGHEAGNLSSLITCNFTPFYPIEMGFSL